MLFKAFASVAVVATTLLTGASAQYNAAYKNMTAVYWGQNAVYAADQSKPLQYDLLTTCNNTNVDIVIISFVTKFIGKSGYPVINLSNQCGTVFPNATNPKVDTDILSCPQIGTMITQCQKLGKKILLSLGGATLSTQAFKDAPTAQGGANALWAMFGPPGSNPFTYRPFANATIDGYDFDFEHTANKPFLDTFAKQLRAKFDTNKSRQYLLTAAPQCPLPDATLDTALTTISFDAVFIQFYNNACGANKWKAGQAQTSNSVFNLQMWQTWATTKSLNKNVKLFVGFIAGGLPGTTGYVAKATAQQIVAESQKLANFGGASFWDSSVCNGNSAYLPGVRSTLVSYVTKRDVETVSVEARQIKSPVGGAATYTAEEFVEAKVPADAFNRFKRRHAHHRRSRFLG
ncbi:hypothetical protein H072_4649 [Dactylellina haptotyla CBS 200.50]|uniref:GH18 domain-containing protein n=1 Tax=Dactylellina haptotyla (strain CBS 200.50) TaxID=1284197 RepID=S8AK03_DACHA|nr:hypothetical protein H072_4649 [Dactylellina haptotyla CBS 200.50]